MNYENKRLKSYINNFSIQWLQASQCYSVQYDNGYSFKCTTLKAALCIIFTFCVKTDKRIVKLHWYLKGFVSQNMWNAIQLLVFR